jgi:hypothetical protein
MENWEPSPEIVGKNAAQFHQETIAFSAST